MDDIEKPPLQKGGFFCYHGLSLDVEGSGIYGESIPSKMRPIDYDILAWSTIANELGLTFQNGNPARLYGEWNGHQLTIRVVRKKQSISTEFRLNTGRVFNTSFQLTKQGVVQSLADMVGSKDIQIGEAKFDEALLIKGWSDEVVRFLFQSDVVRKACFAIFENDFYHDVSIANEGVSLSVDKEVASRSGIEWILEDLLKVIQLLVEADIQYEKRDEGGSAPEPVIVEELPAEEIIEPVVESPTHEPVVEEIVVTEPEQPEELQLEQDVDWLCSIQHIVPISDNHHSGWLVSFVLGRPVKMTDGRKVLVGEYRIGKQRKQAFDSQTGTQMKIVGKVVGFESSNSMVTIDSGDESEPVTSYTATVLVEI